MQSLELILNVLKEEKFLLWLKKFSEEKIVSWYDAEKSLVVRDCLAITYAQMPGAKTEKIMLWYKPRIMLLKLAEVLLPRLEEASAFQVELWLHNEKKSRSNAHLMEWLIKAYIKKPEVTADKIESLYKTEKEYYIREALVEGYANKRESSLEKLVFWYSVEDCSCVKKRIIEVCLQSPKFRPVQLVLWYVSENSSDIKNLLSGFLFKKVHDLTTGQIILWYEHEENDSYKRTLEMLLRTSPDFQKEIDKKINLDK